MVKEVRSTSETFLRVYLIKYQVVLVVKNPPTSTEEARAMGSIPGEGNGSPLQYSCLGSAMDRRAWQVTVHEVAKSQYHRAGVDLCHLA